jgi:hypothetical protein
MAFAVFHFSIGDEGLVGAKRTCPTSPSRAAPTFRLAHGRRASP